MTTLQVSLLSVITALVTTLQLQILEYSSAQYRHSMHMCGLHAVANIFAQGCR